MGSEKNFEGFPEGRMELIPVPDLFFRDLIPKIDNLNELKVTLYAFWALTRRGGSFKYLVKSRLLKDKALLTGLTGEEPKGELLEAALAAAERRGTLLPVELEFAGEPDRFYFLNSAKGRAGAKAAERGEWRPGPEQDLPIELELSKPNIYQLYEQNIGPLTPMIAESLREAEKTYPASWIEDATRIAVENNVRKWRYIEAILQGWYTQGRDDREDRSDTEKARRKYLQGDFDDF
jgi:DnaD/phage-associated family protein